tara:strand:+ start:3927 stop:4103 length:177 start_codon:yes stop_codon:yes gene_type:complete
MNENLVAIYEKELKDAKWDLSYHTQRLEKAKCLIDLFESKLLEAKAEQELLADYTDEC